MDAQRWQKIKEIFSLALEREGAERDRFVAESCSGVPSLRDEVNRLLTWHERSGDLFSNPAVTLADSSDLNPRFDPGQVIAGRFRVIRFIARGGMGEVYEAEDKALEERVALKAILPTIGIEDRLPQIKQEIQSARRVTHPNVCRIHDMVEQNDPPLVLLTMELLEGQTLSQHLREHGPFSLRDALPLIRQIAAGLQSAHDSGVIHRDFKSGNVILVRNAQVWRPVITDFGLAVSIGSLEETPGKRAGTPGYMAPEQLEGGPTTPATDVYALGVVISEMIGARKPSDSKASPSPAAGRTDAAIQAKRLGPWRRVIERCLEKEPSKRYQRPKEVAGALDRINRPKKYAAIIGALAALAILVFFLYWRNTQVPPNSAITTRWVDDKDTGRYAFYQVSSDGKWLLGAEMASGSIVLHNPNTGKTRFLTRMRRALTGEFDAFARFSRDGNTVAYVRGKVGNQGEFRLVGIDGQNDRFLLHDSARFASVEDWSSDGSRLLVRAIYKGRTTLAILSVGTDTLTPIIDLTPDRTTGRVFRFSPSGTEVWLDGLQQGTRKTRGIFAITLDGKHERLLLAESSNTYLTDISPDGHRLVFFSDRDGDTALWTVLLESGMPAGQLTRAVDIKENHPLGFTRDGALYLYASSIATNDAAYLGEIDADAKITRNTPHRVLSSDFAVMCRPAWSSKGQLGFMALKASQSTPRLVLIALSTTGSIREFPTKLYWKSLNWRTAHSMVGYVVSDYGDKKAYYEVDSQTGEIKLLIDAKTIGAKESAGVWSPDGNIWYNCFDTAQKELFRHDLRSGRSRIVYVPNPGTAIHAESLALSPDGKMLAFLVYDMPDRKACTLTLIDPDGGEPRKLWTMRKPNPLFLESSYSWLPDSKRLLVGVWRSGESELWIVPADGATPSKIKSPGFASVGGVKLGPDGRTMVYLTRDGSAQIGVVENLLPSYR